MSSVSPAAPSSRSSPVSCAGPALVRPDAAARRAAAYPASDPRLAPFRADVARRLRPVLRAAGIAYPEAAFDALVLDMARVALHWSLAEVAGRGRTPPLGQPAIPAPPA